MTTALAKIDFNKGNNKPDANKNLTRTGIQLSLAPVVNKVFEKLTGEGYDPMNNVAHARRTLRAMMILAIQPLLQMGAPKEFMRQQLMDALDAALEEHGAKFKKALPSDHDDYAPALKDYND